ncbi:MAG: NAD(P)H-quinone oxidoreductase [Actinomycetota bacterium]
MRAITVPAPGGPEVMELSDVPHPTPGHEEILIATVAAGVNRADILQRGGHYPPPPGASPLLGLECSGTVAAMGAEVNAWKVGDQVCALLTGGGYAEGVVVPTTQVLPVPTGMSVVDAAGLPEAVCTAWLNLVRVAALQAGETVLIHGGSSGVGSMAIQLSRSLGARVVVTAGSSEKLAYCQRLGAEVAINYRDDDFVSVVRDFTGDAGADVILDCIGAAYASRNLDALAWGGRLVLIGLLGGRRAEMDLAAVISKNARLIGSTLRSLPRAEKTSLVAEVRARVWPMIEDGRVRSMTDGLFPIADAASAHHRMESSAHCGKILLTF